MSTKIFSYKLFAGIFFTAMSVLVFQVALTRVFSIIMWHHHAYLVVSVALLGFGASGSLLTGRGAGRMTERATARSLSQYTLWCCIAIAASFFVVTRLRVNSMELMSDPWSFLGFLACLLVLALPFLLAGLAIGTCLVRFSNQAGILYCVDLVGAAAGALITPLLLSRLGITATVMAAATLAAAGAVGFSALSGRRFLAGAVVLLTMGTLVCAGFAGNRLFWEVRFAPSKQHMFSNSVADPDIIRVYSIKIPFLKARNLLLKRTVPDMSNRVLLHSSVAQVDVWPARRMPMMVAGDFGDIDRQTSRIRMVTQDGTNPTYLFADASDLSRYPSLDDTQVASAYVALGASGRNNPEVLVIGIGGGIDVMIALFHDAASVTAVELNKAMIHMVTDRFADFIGNLFSDPKINLIHEDGRSYLNRTDRKYDLIQLTGVDTLSALASGAYTLSESYLYTVESIKIMYAGLKDGGCICYSRMSIPLYKHPRETIRLANTVRTALEELGVPEPWKHVVILQGDIWASTMIRKGPFTLAETQALEEFSRNENFCGMIFNPLSTQGGPDHSQAGKHGPKFDERLAIIKGYYNLLLRGESEQRAVFVENYPFNLAPPTDNKPFFFNYYKFTNIRHWWGLGVKGKMIAQYVPELPAGHMVLLVSLLQITVLALVLILGPAWFLKTKGIRTRHKLRTFAYFSALGLGFIFVEIALMQKFILFFGHPAYAISVVLAGLLAFSGAGALFSSRLAPDKKVIMKTCMVIAVLCVANALLIDFLLRPLLGMPLGLRMVLALLFIAPTGFVLGIPFPLGIRILDKQDPDLIAWGWAINGFFTVLGSILAIIFAMTVGFKIVLVGAGLVYGACLWFGPAAAQKINPS